MTTPLYVPTGLKTALGGNLYVTNLEGIIHTYAKDDESNFDIACYCFCSQWLHESAPQVATRQVDPGRCF